MRVTLVGSLRIAIPTKCIFTHDHFGIALNLQVCKNKKNNILILKKCRK